LRYINKDEFGGIPDARCKMHTAPDG